MTKRKKQGSFVWLDRTIFVSYKSNSSQNGKNIYRDTLHSRYSTRQRWAREARYPAFAASTLLRLIVVPSQ